MKKSIHSSGTNVTSDYALGGCQIMDDISFEYPAVEKGIFLSKTLSIFLTGMKKGTTVCAIDIPQQAQVQNGEHNSL